MSSYEDFLIGRIDRQRPTRPVIKKPESERRREPLPVLKTANRPELSDFTDVYGAVEVAADRGVIDKARSHFAEGEKLNPEEEKEAKAFELALAGPAETLGFFGEKTTISLASEYDDIVNRSARGDVVVEFDDPEYGEPLALLIDATTTSRSIKAWTGKFMGNLARVLGKDKLEIKYYVSPETGKKGKLAEPVPVIVGLDRKHLGELLSSVDRYKKTPTEAAFDWLKNHPVRFVILEEIREQLSFYLEELSHNRLSGDPEALGNKRMERIKEILGRIEVTLQENDENRSLSYENSDQSLGLMYKVVDEERGHRAA